MQIDWNFKTDELARFLNADPARLPKWTRKLGVGQTRQGKPRIAGPTEAAVLFSARKLMWQGLSEDTALALVAQIPHARWVSMAESDQPLFMVVTRNPTGRPKYSMSLATTEELIELAGAREQGLDGLTIVSLYEALKAAFAAALESQRRAAEGEQPPAAEIRPAQPAGVERFRGDRRLSGIFLRGGGRLDLVREGLGLSIQLAPTEMHELAQALIEVADSLGPNTTQAVPQTDVPETVRRPIVN
jgi:hypothetical protein